MAELARKLSDALSAPSDRNEPPTQAIDILEAAENNDLEAVIAASYADPSVVGDQDTNTGVTALHIAAGNGNYSMVEWLLTKSVADPYLRDKFGRDSIDLARASGNKSLFDFMATQCFPELPGD